jgi:D-lactate dehydrogenase
MSNIVFFDLRPWEQEYLQKKLSKYRVQFSTEYAHSADLKPYRTAEVVSIFATSQLTAAVLAKFPKLKLVAARTTGFDNIDLAYCAKHKIKVVNVPSYGENTVAEQAFALLLHLTRKVADGQRRVKAGNWSFNGLQGVDLKGRTMGVIGLGRIGAHTARIAKGFGMNVVAYDVIQHPELAKEIGFRYVLLAELLKVSNVISVHTFLVPETHHLLDRKAFRSMKKGAILINTARGPIVDSAALAEALLSGRLAGAGLDVLEGEEYLRDPQLLAKTKLPAAQIRSLMYAYQLLAMPNVVVTPHNAFNTSEALQRILDTTVVNIKAFAIGKPINLVSTK